MCCCSWGHKESDTTEQLNDNKCLAVLGLCCHEQTVSSCGDQGLLSGCGAGASHHRLLLLWSAGSRVLGIQ